MDVEWGKEVSVLNRWDALPEECKSMILSSLSTKEVARIARVSKEFLKAVTVLRSSVHLLVLPPTLSMSALEGMVAAHPNLRSLSFKRCGLKLKSFVSIIRAAAAGHTTSKLESEASDKKKTRSLESVDFRNCIHLLDTDVSLLCSLHSRLEEVDLSNCPCLSDNALLTLSRYQHVEPPSDPLEKYKCYPRFAAVTPTVKTVPEVTSDGMLETEEMFLKDNDAAVFEEIQGLALNGSSHFRSWPRLGGSGDRSRRENTVSTRKTDEDRLGYSPYAAKRSDAKVTASSYVKKSYAQMTAESLGLKASHSPVNTCREKETSTVQAPQSVSVADQATISALTDETISVPQVPHSKKPVDLDPTLTFIDWSLCGTNAAPLSSRSSSKMGSDVELPQSSNIPFALHEPSGSENATANKYHVMYRQYLLNEVEHSSTALPAFRDKSRSELIQLNRQSQVHSSPILAQVDDNGNIYSNVKTSLSGDRMTRTQTSVYFPKNFEDKSKASDKGKQSSGRKSVCIAGATEVKDERLDVSKGADCNAEAFCRSTNHVAVFAISDNNSRGRSELAESHNLRESDGHPGPRALDSPSQLAICLPGGMTIGGKPRRNKQPDPSTSEADYILHSNLEIPQGARKSVLSELNIDAEIVGTKGVKGLKAVHLAGCLEITDRGVQALLKGALRTCLSTLDVSRCGGVTNAGLRIPARSGLQQLIAVQMPGINRLVYQLPTQSFLQHLNLANCYKLEELVLVAPSLKTLNLANCKKLTRFQLKCPSLTSLNLSLCDQLERFVSLQCGELQNLNLYGCRMLVQSAFNAAVELATGLEELRCGGCDRIERLDLAQPNLLTLEVSGSQGLRRLFCQSRVLKVVDASGCKCLAEVYLYSPYLRRILFSNCGLLQILVLPLDAIKESMDTAAAQAWRRDGTPPDALEIAISGCNMPDNVKKNLGKLTKQWHSCFKS